MKQSRVCYYISICPEVIVTPFLPWEPHEQCEKEKIYGTERWTSQVTGAQNAPGEDWRNNSRKIEESQSVNNAQLRMWLVMQVKSDAVKNNIA